MTYLKDENTQDVFSDFDQFISTSECDYILVCYIYKTLWTAFMKNIKLICHWVAFIVGGSIGTWIVLAIATVLPLYVGLLLFTLSDFLFYFIGSILLTFYYILIFVGLTSFFTILNNKKPDYWISNVLIVVITVLFFYNSVNKLAHIVTQDPKLFINFKGVVLIIALLPAYFKILFYALIFQFIREDG